MSLVKPFRILEDEADVGPKGQRTWRIWQRVGRTGKSGYTCLEWMRFGQLQAAEDYLKHHSLPPYKSPALWTKRAEA